VSHSDNPSGRITASAIRSERYTRDLEPQPLAPAHGDSDNSTRHLTTAEAGDSSLSVLGDGACSIDVRQLNGFALNGLPQMFNKEAQLFCRILRRTESGLRQEGTSQQYTIMALLGLHRLAAASVSVPVAISGTVELMLERSDWVKNIGDIGLMLWVSAVASPEYLEQVVTKFNVKQALEYATERNTMDLALFLAGLAHHSSAEVGRLSDLTDQGVHAFHLLKENQGEEGIFGHCARRKSISGVIRGRIGSFVDQSYSIYALSKAAQAYSLEQAATTALDCALTICQAQGPLGQWWWHYDALTGRVLGRYPIFSVHQAGTAPMALMELGKTLQSDFDPWIVKGLNWLCGANELAQDLRDPASNVIWGCICQNKMRKLVNTAFAYLLRREGTTSYENLSVRHECRPYDHGMLLYAFGSNGLQ
jgi:hypothetical protein